ncbi:DUF1007 family protein [Rhizobium sp. NRK18]|uniref:DUF1007 family protein n=1 Tax=Rhizobium sp. NRK18 TaxID=2964667 RepID=UPI0021C4175E|nr:DUF1007 family protein [Rhizobium sp. NRK18]MCQ2003417.1 DUF1007 family protein [Rhizobium sp. NRK18]
MRRPLLALALLAAGALPAFAHPDIAVTVRVLFNVKDGNLAALAETWTFDSAYSAYLIKAFDANTDGAFDPDENQALAAKMKADLSGLGYLTRLSAEDGTQFPLNLSAFHVEIRDGDVTVSLGLTPPEAVPLAGRSLSAIVADTGYIADMRLADDRPAMIRGDDAATNCTTTISPAPDNAYFGGLVTPEKITLTCQ